MITRFLYFNNIFFCVLILGISISLWGCASTKSKEGVLKETEYKSILERQQESTSVTGKEEAIEENHKMTPEECERRGDNYLKHNNIDMAFIQYDRALRLNPNQPDINYKMGYLFLKKGLLEEAKEKFENILKDDPSYALAYSGMGQAYLKSGEFDKAKEKFQQAIELDTGLWQAYNFIGIIYNNQQRFEEAITQYKAAIDLKPDSVTLLNNLGMSYYFNGEYEKAAEVFMRTLRVDDSRNKVCNNLALTLSKLRRYEDAFNIFKRCGNEVTAYNNIGYVYMMDGKYKEAVKSFEKSIEMSPKLYVKAYNNLKKAKMVVEKSYLKN